MSPGPWQLLIILVLVLLLFGGRGKISSIMGDMARGISSFRKGLREEDAEAEPSTPPKAIEDQTPERRASEKRTETRAKS